MKCFLSPIGPSSDLERAIVRRHQEKQRRLLHFDEVLPPLNFPEPLPIPHSTFENNELSATVNDVPSVEPPGRSESVSVASTTTYHFPKYALFVLLLLVVPIALLTLSLFVLRDHSITFCDVDCHCSIGDSASFLFTVGLILHAPRCLLFACLTESIIHVRPMYADGVERTSTRWDIPTLIWILLHRKGVWALFISSLVLILLVQMSLSPATLPSFVKLLLVFLSTTAPFLMYCAIKRHIRSAGCIIFLQIVPLLYKVMLPAKATNWSPWHLTLWPLTIAVIDRACFYLFYAMSPQESIPVALKVICSFIIVAFPQAVGAVKALALDDAASTAPFYIFLACLVLFECIFSTLAIERLHQQLVDKILRLSCAVRCGVTEDTPILADDFRIVATNVRLTSVLIVLGVTLAITTFRRSPLKVDGFDCNGASKRDFEWYSFVGLAVAHCIAALIVLISRAFFGLFRPPLFVRDFGWAIVCGLYLVVLCTEAFNFITIDE